MTETETAVDPVSMATVAIADGGTATEAIQSDPCFTIEIEHDDDARRRHRYEPCQDGPGWWCFEEKWTGTAWAVLEQQRVRSVSLSVDGGSII